jgi:hypothetical protein
MAGFRVLLRLTVILRPALLVVLIALYLSPLATHGWRSSWQRGEQALAARSQYTAALARADQAAHAAPVYFQAALFAPLKSFGSDLCYAELTRAQTRVVESMAVKNAPR